MRLVVDANIVLAAIIRKSTTRHLIFTPLLELYAPEHLMREVARHIESDEEILKKTRLSKVELTAIFDLLLSRITILPQEKFAGHMSQALRLAPHKEDAPFLALALCLSCPLWTSDGGIAKQQVVKTITTAQLIRDSDL